MLKIEEIRINNWVKIGNSTKSKPFKIDEEVLQSQDFWEDMHYKNIYGIKITHEILLANNFKMTSNKALRDIWKAYELKGRKHFRIIWTQSLGYQSMDFSYMKYVHELQMLFYTKHKKEIIFDL